MTPEEIERLVAYKGFDPKTHTVDEINRRIIPKPVSATETTQVPQGESSAFGAFVRSAAQAVGPSLAGLAAGAGVLAVAGGAETATGVGAPIGIPQMLLSGAVAAGAGYGASKLQDLALTPAFKQQLATDYEQHPVASTIGQFVPNLIGFKLTTPGQLVKAARGLIPGTIDEGAKQAAKAAILQAGINTGVGAGLRQVQGGSALDPSGIATDLAGSLFFGSPRNNALTRRLGLVHPDQDKILANIVDEIQSKPQPFQAELKTWDSNIHGGEDNLIKAREVVDKSLRGKTVPNDVYEDMLVRQAEKAVPAKESQFDLVKAKIPLKQWDPSIHGGEEKLAIAKKQVDKLIKGKTVTPAEYENLLATEAEKIVPPADTTIEDIKARIAANREAVSQKVAKVEAQMAPGPEEPTAIQQQIDSLTPKTSGYVPLSAEAVNLRRGIAEENARLQAEIDQLKQQQHEASLMRGANLKPQEAQVVPEPAPEVQTSKGKIREVPSWMDRTSESSSEAPPVIDKTKEKLTQGMYDVFAKHFGPLQGTEVKIGNGERPDVKGFTDTQTATITPAATTDTPAHEIYGHAFLNKGMSDKNIATHVKNLYSTLEQSPDYQRWSSEAKTKGVDPSVKEYAAQLLGERLATDLSGNRYKTTGKVKYQLDILMKEFKNLFKKATPEDVADLLQNAFVIGAGSRLANVTTKTSNEESSIKAPAIFRSSVDNLKKEGPAAEYISNKLTTTRQDQQLLNGRWRNKIAEVLNELTSSQQRKVDELVSSGGGYIPPALRHAVTTIKGVLKDMHDEQRSRGLLVRDYDEQGKPFYREAKDNPDYNPNIISSDVYEELVNHPESKKSRQLREDFINYYETVYAKAKDPLAQAEERLQQMFPRKGGGVSVDYNAVRLAEGSGLPESWLERSDIKAKYRRYVSKFAADLSYFEHLQKDPVARRLLNIHDDGQGNVKAPMADELPSGEDIKGVNYSTHPDVVASLHDLVGGRQLLPSKVLAFSRLANAVTVGPLGRLRDIASVPAIASEIAGPFAMLKALPKALSEVAEGISQATKRGIIDSNQVTWNDNSLQMLDNAIDKSADFVNKYTGSQALEKVARGFTWILSKTIAESQLDNPAFIKKFGGVKDPSVLADRITEQIQGTYDFRGTPTWMRESAFGPLFSLNRWSVERFGNWKKNVFDEALKGNIKPLIGNAFGIFIGSALIDKLNEEVRRAKPEHLTWEEFFKLGGQDAPYKLAAALSVSGTTGVMGDLALTALNLSQGRQPRGSSMPFLEIGSNVFERIGQFVAAESLDFPALLHQIAKDNIQIYRDLAPKDENRDAKRDVRVFKRLQGDNQPMFSGNPFDNTEAKDIMKSDTPETLIPKIIESIVNKESDPQKKLESLRRSLAHGDNSFIMKEGLVDNKFWEFLVNKEGEKEAMKRLEAYLEQMAKRKALSSAIP